MQNDYDEEHNSPEQFNDEVAEPKLARNFVVPDSKVKLLACQKCRLIKTEAQWKQSNSCENCKGHIHQNDYKKFTSNKFQGMASIIDTTHSWLRRKLALGSNQFKMQKTSFLGFTQSNYYE